jgi:diguanylate cyclase (GGDEF)-like protein
MSSFIDQSDKKTLSYADAVDRIAEKYGVPRSVYSHMLGQESGDNDSAVSSAGAKSAWQIIDSTARGLGYSPDEIVKEPLKAAEGGLRILRDNYKRFRPKAKNEKHAWMMAVAGYHTNPNNVQKDLDAGGLGLPDTSDGAITTRDHVVKIFRNVDGSTLDRSPLKKIHKTSGTLPFGDTEVEVPLMGGGQVVPLEYPNPETLAKLGLKMPQIAQPNDPQNPLGWLSGATPPTTPLPADIVASATYKQILTAYALPDTEELRTGFLQRYGQMKTGQASQIFTIDEDKFLRSRQLSPAPAAYSGGATDGPAAGVPTGEPTGLMDEKGNKYSLSPDQTQITDGSKRLIAADGSKMLLHSDGSIVAENPRLNLGQGEYTQAEDQTGVPKGQTRLVDKKGRKYTASKDATKAPGEHGEENYNLSRELPDWAKGETPAKSQLPHDPVLQKSYETYRKQYHLADTEELRQKFINGYKDVQAGKTKSIFSPEDQDLLSEIETEISSHPEKYKTEQTVKHVVPQKQVESYNFERTGQMETSDGRKLNLDTDRTGLASAEYRFKDEKGETYIINPKTGEIRDDSMARPLDEFDVELLPEAQRYRSAPGAAKEALIGQVSGRVNEKIGTPRSDVAAFYRSKGFRHLNTGTEFADSDYFAKMPGQKEPFSFTRRDAEDLGAFSQKRRSALEEWALERVASGRDFTADEKRQMAENDIDIASLKSKRYDDYELARVKGDVVKKDFNTAVAEFNQSEGDPYIAQIKAAQKVRWMGKGAAEYELSEYKRIRDEKAAELGKGSDVAASRATGFQPLKVGDDKATAAREAQMWALRVIDKYGSMAGRENKIALDAASKAANDAYIAKMPWGEYLKNLGAEYTAGVLESAVRTGIAGTWKGIGLGAKIIDDAVGNLIGSPNKKQIEEYQSWQIGKGVEKDPLRLFNFGQINSLVGLGIGDILKAIPRDPEMKQTFLGGDVPQGLGSTIGMIVGGEAAAGPKVGIWVMTGLQMGSDMYETARENGADEVSAQRAALLDATFLAPLELLGMGRAIERLNKGAGSSVWKKLFAEAWRDGKKEAIEETFQEGLQTVGENVLAQHYFDPDRSYDQGVIRSMAAAGISAGMFSPAVSILNTVRNRGQVKRLIKEEEQGGVFVQHFGDGELKVFGQKVDVTPEMHGSLEIYDRTRTKIARAQEDIEILQEKGRELIRLRNESRKGNLRGLAGFDGELTKDTIREIWDKRAEIDNLRRIQIELSKDLAKAAGIDLAAKPVGDVLPQAKGVPEADMTAAEVDRARSFDERLPAVEPQLQAGMGEGFEGTKLQDQKSVHPEIQRLAKLDGSELEDAIASIEKKTLRDIVESTGEKPKALKSRLIGQVYGIVSDQRTSEAGMSPGKSPNKFGFPPFDIGQYRKAQLANAVDPDSEESGDPEWVRDDYVTEALAIAGDMRDAEDALAKTKSESKQAKLQTEITGLRDKLGGYLDQAHTFFGEANTDHLRKMVEEHFGFKYDDNLQFVGATEVAEKTPAAKPATESDDTLTPDGDIVIGKNKYEAFKAAYAPTILTGRNNGYKTPKGEKQVSPIVKHKGKLYVTYGGTYHHTGSYSREYRQAVQIVPASEYKGKTFSYEEKTATWDDKKGNRGDYEGVKLTIDGKDYVAVGSRVHFTSDESAADTAAQRKASERKKEVEGNRTSDDYFMRTKDGWKKVDGQRVDLRIVGGDFFVHTDNDVASIVDARTGEVLGQHKRTATAKGYDNAIRKAQGAALVKVEQLGSENGGYDAHATQHESSPRYGGNEAMAPDKPESNITEVKPGKSEKIKNTTYIVVPESRLSHGSYGKDNKKTGEGDIAGAYSGDTITQGKLRKPFEHDGKLYTSTGGNSVEQHAYELVDPKDYDGDVFSYGTKKGRGYEGIVVKYKGKTYVMTNSTHFTTQEQFDDIKNRPDPDTAVDYYADYKDQADGVAADDPKKLTPGEVFSKGRFKWKVDKVDKGLVYATRFGGDGSQHAVFSFDGLAKTFSGDRWDSKFRILEPWEYGDLSVINENGVYVGKTESFKFGDKKKLSVEIELAKLPDGSYGSSHAISTPTSGSSGPVSTSPEFRRTTRSLAFAVEARSILGREDLRENKKLVTWLREKAAEVSKDDLPVDIDRIIAEIDAPAKLTQQQAEELSFSPEVVADVKAHPNSFHTTDKSIALHHRLDVKEPWNVWEWPRRLAAMRLYNDEVKARKDIGLVKDEDGNFWPSVMSKKGLRVGDRMVDERGDTAEFEGLKILGGDTVHADFKVVKSADKNSKTAGYSMPATALARTSIRLHPSAFGAVELRLYDAMRKVKDQFGSLAFLSPLTHDFTRVRPEATRPQLEDALKAAREFDPNDYGREADDYRERVETGIKTLEEALQSKDFEIAGETGPKAKGVAKLKEQRDSARRAAETDPLTGIANRAALDRALPAAEADPNTSVISFDANNFGQINKMFGEDAGDQALKKMADDLTSAAADYGSRVFRKGGDEFVVLAPADKAEEVREKAEDTFGLLAYDGLDVTITGTIGKTFAEANASLQEAKKARKGLKKPDFEGTVNDLKDQSPEDLELIHKLMDGTITKEERKRLEGKGDADTKPAKASGVFKTPGTNLTWSNIPEWIAAHNEIDGRHSSSTRHEQLSNHERELATDDATVMIEASPMDDLTTLRNFLKKDTRVFHSIKVDPAVKEAKVKILDAISRGENAQGKAAATNKPKPADEVESLFDEEFANQFGADELDNLAQAQESIRSAAENTKKGLEDAAKGLITLFDPTKFKSVGIPAFDEKQYEKARPLFIQAIQHFHAAGQDTRAAIKSLIEYLKDVAGAPAATIFNMKPYIVRFAKEMEAGTIKFAEPKEKENVNDGRGLDDDGGTSDGGEGTGDVSGVKTERPAKTGGPRKGEVGTVDEGRDDSPGDGSIGDVEQGGVRPGSTEKPGKPKGERGSDLSGDNVPDDKPGRHDFIALEGELAREGSWHDAAMRNLDAIELVKKIEAEDRFATPEEQKVLAKFVGWGATELAQNAFPGAQGSGEVRPDYARQQYRDVAERVKALMTPAEVKSALRSTQYAHYTSEKIVRQIWAGIRQLGFKSGKILDAGMGTGNFLSAAPHDVVAHSKYTGIEMDTMTARIAKQLFQKQAVMANDYVKQKLPNDFFDVSIGNPPYANVRIQDDPAYKKHRFFLHDYFIAKSIDKVRPGGLSVVVTSKGTMDKREDKFRSYMAGKADLLGAIRLPQTAFKQNAGTEVTTDVLFFRKRVPGEEPAGEKWQALQDVKLVGTEYRMTREFDYLVNEYFHTHPEMVLGKQTFNGSRPGGGAAYTVEAEPGQDIEADFAKAVEKLPVGVFANLQKTDEIVAQTFERDTNPKAKKEGSLYVHDDGRLMRRDFGLGVEVASFKKLPPAKVKWLKDYVGLRDALKQAQVDQLQDPEAEEQAPEAIAKPQRWEKSLKKLFDEYEKFVAKHGHVLEYTLTEKKEIDEDTGLTKTVPVRVFKNQALLNLDIEAPLVEALERINQDGEIRKYGLIGNGMTRTINRPRQVEIKTLSDALAVSLDKLGALNLGHVAELMQKVEPGFTREQVIRELGDNIFEEPGGTWLMADEYLSGLVIDKLEIAKAAAETDPKYLRNVDALTKVQPTPLLPAQIQVGLGSNWVPASYVTQFTKQELGLDYSEVTYDLASNHWEVKNAEGPGSQMRRNAREEWGTADRSPYELLSAALNNKTVKVMMTIGPPKQTVVNPEATALANEKVKQLKSRFKSWIWQDADRARELSGKYNRLFNNIAPREFNGSHLSLPGLSARYKLHPHQTRVIWRMIQTGNTYLAHAAGAGKTLEMIVAGMEMRRLGQIKKPMYTVPRHMLKQFSSEYYEAYPLANILVADEEAFKKENRKRFVAQAALNDLDAIIIPHTAFGKIRTKQETADVVVDEMIAQLVARITEIESGEFEGDERAADRAVKRLQKRIELMQRRFQSRAADESTDDVVDFEDLGVDYLFVDEAHEFRKLDFVTNREQVKGVTPDGSRRALDLLIKTRWLDAQRPGRSLSLASGTAITNTLAELYSIQRYLDPTGLEETGLSNFDAWANQFGEVVADYEMNAAGNYEIVERFARFVNIPELMKRVRQFMDVLTGSELAHLVDLPTVKGGQPQVKVVPANERQQEYLKGELFARIERSREWKPSKDEPFNPDPIINIITDARLASLDMRFVDSQEGDDPEARNDETSKLNVMIDDMIADYHKYNDLEFVDNETQKVDPIKGATHIIFAFMGFGEMVAKNRHFDAKAWLVKRAVKGGIPASEIAFISDYKTTAAKEALFHEMRQGIKKILIGSPKNMGTGINVQKRLKTHKTLQPPWYPADVEQPDRRILRQFNQNAEIEMVRYATKGTYDSTGWQMVARKARSIEQAMSGDDSVRTLDDLTESSQYAQASALAAGDERAIQLVGLAADIERLRRLRSAHDQEQHKLDSSKFSTSKMIENHQEKIERLDRAIAKSPEVMRADLEITIDGKTTTARQPDGEIKANLIGEALKEKWQRAVKEHKAEVIASKNWMDVDIATLNNGINVRLSMYVGIHSIHRQLTLIFPEEIKKHFTGGIDEDSTDFDDIDAGGLTTRVLNALNSLHESRAESDKFIKQGERELKQVASKLGQPFPQEQELFDKIAEHAQLQFEMAQSAASGDDVQIPTAAVEAEADFYLKAFAGHATGAIKNVIDRARMGIPAFQPGEGIAPLQSVRNTADMARLQDLRKTGDLGKALPGVTSTNRGTYIEISPEASELLNAAVENAQVKVAPGAIIPPRAAQDGTMLEPDQVKMITDGLKEFIRLATERGYGDQLGGVRELIQNIRSMAKKYKGSVALAVFEDVVPHERVHQASFVGSVSDAFPAGRERSDRYADPAQFANDDDFTQAWTSLNALNGTSMSLGTAIEENACIFGHR